MSGEADVRVILGDCLEVMRHLPDASVDAVVTDPPAGIAFMGKEWDKDKGGRDQWVAWMTEVARECLRVIKPGGHALVWAIPRTSHWTGWAWDNAGWEPRDKVVHLFGSGFPKSLDVSKAIDKAAGAERTKRLAPKAGHENFVGRDNMKALRESGVLSGAGGFSRPWMHDPQKVEDAHWNFAPATPAAQQWQGWGTALKPAAEDWWLFRKPLIGTVAANVLTHGTGAINVDGCRVSHTEACRMMAPQVNGLHNEKLRQGGRHKEVLELKPDGRWPANVALDEEAAAMLDEQTGGASRFFYCAKASRGEREAGLEGLPRRQQDESRDPDAPGANNPRNRGGGGRGNHHPTVKPLALMRWLVRLVTPPGGLVLDPFAGSGTTGLAARAEGFRSVLIEREEEYVEILCGRLGLDPFDDVEVLDALDAPDADTSAAPLSEAAE